MIDVDDLPAHRVLVGLDRRNDQPLHGGHLGPERRGRRAGGQRGGNRREHVPSIEGGAPRREEEPRLGQVDDTEGCFGRRRQREEPVVGTDEEGARRLDAERPPGAADAGVDDRHVHGAGREVRDGRPQHERPGE